MIDALLGIVGALVVLATALPFIRAGWWWVRVCDFPRLQLFALGLAVLGLLLVRRPEAGVVWAVMAALAAAVAFQGYRILPYTPLYPLRALASENPDPARKLCLLIVNVLMRNRRARDVLERVRATEPDVLLAVETDEFWARELAALDPAYPHRIYRPQDNTYGLVLLSKLELRDAKIRFLMDDDVPSVTGRLVLRCGDEVDFYAVHPRPPRTNQPTWDRDAELLVVAREIRERAEPAIVAGDLNDVAWSHTTRLFRRMSNLLDPRIGRGLYASFDARYPLLRWPLDHIFFSEDFRLVRLERLGFVGSDHFPILVELSYEPEGAGEQEARAMRPGDRALARRKIRRGGDS